MLLILPQYEALQTKQRTLEMQIPDISIGFFCKRHIMVDPDNPLLSFVQNSTCLYIQYRVLLGDECMSDVCTTSLNNVKMELFEGVGVSTSFLHNTSSTRV